MLILENEFENVVWKMAAILYMRSPKTWGFHSWTVVEAHIAESGNHNAIKIFVFFTWIKYGGAYQLHRMVR